MTTRRSTSLAAALVASVLAQVAFSQTTQPDDTVGVFVRDSAVAADKLNLADRMAKAQQWDTAAEVYQEVLDGFADRVIAIHSDSQGRPDRYGGVTTVVQDRIGTWPDAGREVYISRYATVAAQQFAAADPNDRVALSKIIDRYFVTDAGRDAALRLIELHFEAGEFSACAALADRLLDHHPSIANEDRPLLLLRSTLAWTLAGETKRANDRADELKAKFPDVRATLGGQDQVLSDVAAAEIAKPRPNRTASAARSDAWPVPFGSNDHAGVIPEPDAPARGAPPREWGKLMSIELKTDPTPAGNNNDNDQDAALIRSALKRQRDLGSSTGILPSIDGAQMFFQDNAHIYARDLTTDAPPIGWQQTYPGSAGIYPVPNAASAPRAAQMTVTLTDRYVLAIVGQSEPLDQFNGNGMVRGPEDGARLVCLDRATGKVLWWKRMSDVNVSHKDVASSDPADSPLATDAEVKAARRARQIAAVQGRRAVVPNAVPGAANAAAIAAAKDHGDESLRQTEPGGSALVVGDTVYVVTRGGEVGAFDDCYLVAFALDDGAFRWARHLASGNVAGANFNGYMQPPKHADSHLAAADGRIFVSTDMGAIAAVDAADGSLAWLSLYPRPRPQQMQMFFNQNNNLPRARPAFEGNPVIIRDGKVLSLPADGEYLFVHDVSTGQEIARLPIKWRLDEDYVVRGPASSQPLTASEVATSSGVDENSVLVGLAGDNVVLASAQSVSVIDWTKLIADPAGRPNLVGPDAALVSHRMIVRPGNEDRAIRGRPFLTDHSIYVPTAWQLIRFTPDAKFVIETYPAVNGGDWSDRPDESPGNVVVVGGNVIVAGPDRVSVYAGLGLVRQRLDAAIAAAPDSIAPRLRYAEAMANAGHADEAMKWIDEAATKLANPRRADNDPDRALVFDECAQLVRNLNRPGRPADLVFQAKLLARLAEAAGTARQQVASRLLRGGLAAKSNDYAAAVEAYQQLLDDPTWSTARAKTGEDTTPIGKIAADAIAAILATDPAARTAYAATEARAADALQTARAANDPAALLAVADRYPNATAANDAIHAANDLLTRSVAASPDKADGNLVMLRRLADRLNAPAERSALGEAMLRSYLASGDLAAALGRARRIAWQEPGRAIDGLPGIQSSTAADIVAELQRAIFAKAEAALPDLKANLDGDSFDAANIVAVPKVSTILAPEDLSHSRHDRLVTIAQNLSLQIFEPGAAKPLQTIAVPNVTDRTAITWLAGDRLLLRQPTRVACVDTTGQQLAWSFDPASVTADSATPGETAGALIDDAGLIDLAPRPPEVAARTEEAPPSPQDQAIRQLVELGRLTPAAARRQLQIQRQMQRQVIIAPQNGAAQNVRVINNNGQMIVVNGVPLNDGVFDPDPMPEGNAKEMVVDARAAGDGAATVVIATNRGRLIALDAVTGKVRWTVKPGDRAPAALRVAGDVVVFVTTDESASRVLAFDANTGQEVLHRTITDADGGRVCNVAVSDEGFLGVVTSSGVQLFDLFGGEREPLASVMVPGEAGVPPFGTSRSPGQVQFCGGRLLVLADALQPSASVRSFDLPKLTPTFTQDSSTKQRIERRYLPRFAKDQRGADDVIDLQVHKDRLYVLTSRFMTSFPALDTPGEMAWSPATPDVPRNLSLQSPMFVRDGVLTIGWPHDFLNQATSSVDLQLYDRRKVGDEGESGMCVEQVELMKKGAKLIDRFHPVTGGLYYMTNDSTLMFLPGKPKT